MTPKQRAKELFDKFYYLFPEKQRIDFGYKESKQCALIAVDELIESHLVLTTTHDLKPSVRCRRYWQEVKQEIINL